MAVLHRHHLADPEAVPVPQGVDGDDALGQVGRPAGQVEGRARRSGDRGAADRGDLARVDQVPVDAHAAAAVALAAGCQEEHLGRGVCRSCDEQGRRAGSQLQVGASSAGT